MPRGAPGSARAKEATPPSERGAARAVDARARALENYRTALKQLEGDEDGGDETKRRRSLERAKKQLQRAHQKLKTKRSELTAEQRQARDDKLAAWLEKARADRDKRRDERLTQWKQTHGDRLESPAFRNELLRHSWRVARLERLAQIAEAEGREELKTKAQELLEKEKAHHERRLAQLVAGKSPKKDSKGIPATAKSPAPPAAHKPAAQKGAE